MALADHKITELMIQQKGVIAAPDRLRGTASENKQVFDRLIRETVRSCFNGLVDELASELDPGNEQGRLTLALAEALRQAEESGAFDGPPGPPGGQGEPGRDGAVVDMKAGVFAMTVSGDGHLLVMVNDGQTPPDMRIDPESGHLIYEIN